MAQIDTPLTFTVRRRAPELIVPAISTPRELKLLSDIDDQKTLRHQFPGVHFYRGDPRMKNKNPASVVREALAKVLVFYYPIAGRLKEGPGGKLMVDCSAQGVLFIEAEADVTLEQFGVALQPPFPCMEELLYNVPGGILDSPLMIIQVTRLLCGGFIFAVRFHHTMMDGFGYTQFMTALSEMTLGSSTPSTLPIWQRELLCARDPPRVTCTHHEYDDVAETKGTIIPHDDMANKSFYFGPTEISALRRFVPIHLKKCSTFEVLTACLWRCRTIALQPNPNDEMRVICVVNARNRFNPPIPLGYYGNVLAFPTAISTARDLCNKPLGHALELVMKAKNEVNEEYMRSYIDLLVIKGRPHVTNVQAFLVSDLSRAKLDGVDFGWGKAAYAGPTNEGDSVIPSIANFYMPFVNRKGDCGIVVPLRLPSVAMERFVVELNNMLMQDQNFDQGLKKHKSFAPSKI